MNFLSIGKSSITVFFSMGIMVLISTALVAYLNSRDQLDSNDYITEGYKKINAIENINSFISEAEASRRGYQLTGDIQHLQVIDDNRHSADSLLKMLRLTSNENPKLQQRTDTLFRLVNERFELFKQAIYIIDNKNGNSKLLKPITDRGKILKSDINLLLARMKNDELTTITTKHELGDQSYKFTFYTIAGGTVVCCIIFIVIFIYMRRNSNLKSQEDEEITKEELEIIVRDRTAELSQINNRLNNNISELQKMDTELKQSVNYYKMLFDQAHDPIIILNPDDEKVLDVNKRACEIYGFKREEFIGLSLKSISKNVQMGEENIKKTLQTGFFHNFQTVHYSKSLNELLMEINASVIEYNGKKAILSINRDITDRVLMIH